MSDLELLAIWEALVETNWHRADFWDSQHTITMEDWAESILSERYSRDLHKTNYAELLNASA